MPTVEKPTAAESETAKQGKNQPRNRGGRPPKGTDRIPTVMGFFKRVSAIEKADWGTRAYITLYRLEPSIDRVRLGEPKHIAKYAEPIDEDRIKQDQGSGRYRLYLTYKAPNDRTDQEIDSMDIDILDMNFPPKLAKGEWLDIPQNKKWEWCRTLLPDTAAQQQQQKQSATGDLVAAMDVIDQVQARAEERMKPMQGRQESTLEIIRAVREITPTPAPATDNKMLDTIVTLMNGQLDRMSRDNQELRKEIAESRKAPETKGSVLGNLSELVAEAQKIGLIPEGGLKGLWGDAKNALQGVARSRMSGTEEFLQPILTQFAEGIKPAIPMIIGRIIQPQPRPQPAAPTAATLPAGQPAPAAPAPPNGAPAPATAAPETPPTFDDQQALAFFSSFAQAFVKFFQDQETGGDFAAYIHEGYGADWQGVKWLWLKAQVTPDRIVNGFKATPLWPEIASAEEKFLEFAKEFIDWQPAAAETIVDLQDQQEEPAQ